ncbi:LRIF1 factor, partial [Turnix velox]|nr:LRIF1 factor [Turnix velox]
SVAGCVYRVLQTTGPDGKNLLKLLPIPKSSGSFLPIAQAPPAMPNHSKPNLSSQVQLAFKAQLSSSSTPSSSLKVFQPPNSGNILLLPRNLDKEEGPDDQTLIPSSTPEVQSGGVVHDNLSLQNSAVSSSSSKTYMFINSSSVPAAMKTPILPSGHHLQIPANAEVKSLPASSLPPAIQQKILAASSSGGAESSKMPTVIYMSPVETVKTIFPKYLQAIHPKPRPEVSSTLIVTSTQEERSSSPELVASDGQQNQQPGITHVVQDSPQFSFSSCFIPVKSSNNVASKILKTLSDSNNVEDNSANILPLCPGAGGSQTQVTPFKDNALVMYNGKVYLLTKKSCDILAAHAEKQTSPPSSDASLKTETSKLMDSPAVKKITNKVMNLMLGNHKGVVVSPKDPNPGLNSKRCLRSDFKSTPDAPQQSSPDNQNKSLPLVESISSWLTPVGVEEKGWQSGREKVYSPKTQSAPLPQPEQESAVGKDQPKIQWERMDPPAKGTQIKPHWKQYLEIRKKFGLYKEERVYLKRIPSRKFQGEKEERGCSRNCLERTDEPCSSPLLEVETTQQQEPGEEEKIIVDLEEDVTRKRKIKSSPLPDSGKRRRTLGRSTNSPGSENTSERSSSPPLLLVQENLPTEPVEPSGEKDLEQEPTSPCPQVTTDSCIPALVACEDDTSLLEGSFRDDAFPSTPPDLDETIRDEKIVRLKQLLREREAALEEMRRK